MTRRPFLVAITAALAAPAAAQVFPFTSDSTLSMPLSWSEVNGNNNGLLEPGESAAIRLDLSFSNQFGVAHFSPPIGTFTSGTILGFGSGYIDLDGSGGTTGAFRLGNNPPPQTNNGATGYGLRGGWRIVGNASPGSVNAAGTGVTQVQFGQSPGPGLENTLNPIPSLYRLLWTPASYAQRSVTFAISGHAPPTVASILLLLDGSISAYVYVDPANLLLGSVVIPIAPAPATLVVIAALAVPLRRSRPPPRATA